jgi:hypothetical protein
VQDARRRIWQDAHAQGFATFADLKRLRLYGMASCYAATGKTHLATAIGIDAVTRHSKRVRFYSTVELVNTLEQRRRRGVPGASRTNSRTWISSCSTNGETSVMWSRPTMSRAARAISTSRLHITWVSQAFEPLE